MDFPFLRGRVKSRPHFEGLSRLGTLNGSASGPLRGLFGQNDSKMSHFGQNWYFHLRSGYVRSGQNEAKLGNFASFGGGIGLVNFGQFWPVWWIRDLVGSLWSFLARFGHFGQISQN